MKIISRFIIVMSVCFSGNAFAGSIWSAIFGGNNQPYGNQGYTQQGYYPQVNQGYNKGYQNTQQLDYRSIYFVGNRPMLGGQPLSVSYLYQNTYATTSYLNLYPENTDKMIYWLQQEANKGGNSGKQAYAVLTHSGFVYDGRYGDRGYNSGYNSYPQYNYQQPYQPQYQPVNQPSRYNEEPTSIREMLERKTK